MSEILTGVIPDKFKTFTSESLKEIQLVGTGIFQPSFAPIHKDGGNFLKKIELHNAALNDPSRQLIYVPNPVDHDFTNSNGELVAGIVIPTNLFNLTRRDILNLSQPQIAQLTIFEQSIFVANLLKANDYQNLISKSIYKNIKDRSIYIINTFPLANIREEDLARITLQVNSILSLQSRQEVPPQNINPQTLPSSYETKKPIIQETSQFDTFKKDQLQILKKQINYPYSDSQTSEFLTKFNTKYTDLPELGTLVNDLRSYLQLKQARYGFNTHPSVILGISKLKEFEQLLTNSSKIETDLQSLIKFDRYSVESIKSLVSRYTTKEEETIIYRMLLTDLIQYCTKPEYDTTTIYSMDFIKVIENEIKLFRENLAKTNNEKINTPDSLQGIIKDEFELIGNVDVDKIKKELINDVLKSNGDHTRKEEAISLINDFIQKRIDDINNGMSPRSPYNYRMNYKIKVPYLFGDQEEFVDPNGNRINGIYIDTNPFNLSTEELAQIEEVGNQRMMIFAFEAARMELLILSGRQELISDQAKYRFKRFYEIITFELEKNGSKIDKKILMKFKPLLEIANN